MRSRDVPTDRRSDLPRRNDQLIPYRKLGNVQNSRYFLVPQLMFPYQLKN
jgi:hypothetical protein